MKKAILPVISIAVFCLLLIGVFLFSHQAQTRESSFVIINGQKISVLLAQTEEERTQGLSNHPPLDPNQGMLFIFPQATKGSFWMKDMLFPLDLIWIRNDRIVELSTNVPPPSQTNEIPETIFPHAFYTHVIETTGGWVDSKKIGIGHTVEFHLVAAP